MLVVSLFRLKCIVMVWCRADCGKLRFRNRGEDDTERILK